MRLVDAVAVESMGIQVSKFLLDAPKLMLKLFCRTTAGNKKDHGTLYCFGCKILGRSELVCRGAVRISPDEPI